jgi:hypothetical protein
MVGWSIKCGLIMAELLMKGEWMIDERLMDDG